ncbi:MAG: Hsp20/alpha crystallin family protein [Candidatus Eiseniibacteriota bacterium]
MTLVRWMPSRSGRELVSLRDSFDKIFGEMLTGSPWAGDLAPLFAPPADIHETADEFVVKLDLPGVSLKDIKVNLTGETLSVRGERSQEKNENGASRHRVERVYGSFERTFTLRAPLRGDQVKATYKDGVLEIHVPKADEAKVREIEIQVS